MKRSLLFFSTVLLLASCDKRPTVECDPPPPDNLSYRKFLVRGSNGENLLRTTGSSRLDAGKLGVVTNCNIGQLPAFEADSFLQITHAIVTDPERSECRILFLKWNDTDTDTLSYSISAAGEQCGKMAYQIDNLFFNSKTVLKDNSGSYYILQK